MSDGWRQNFLNVLAALDAFGLPDEVRAALGDGVVLKTIISGPIDATTLGATVEVCPALPGFTAVSCLIQPVFDDDAAGTVSTAATAKIGTNAGHDDWLSALANFPLGNTVTPAARRVATTPVNIPAAGKDLLDLAAPAIAEITVAATGVGLTANMRLITRLSLIRTADF